MILPYPRVFALFCLTLFTGGVFAQTVTAPTPTEAAHGAVYGVLIWVVAHWVPLLFAAIGTTLLPLAASWLNAQRKIKISQGKSTVLLDIALKFEHLAELAVASSDAKNLVGDIAARASNGELTAADGVALKTDAVQMVKTWASPEGMKQLAAALGTPSKPADPATVDSYIGAHVEVAVDAKNAAAPA